MTFRLRLLPSFARFGSLALCLAIPPGVRAAPPNLPAKVPPAMQQDLETLQRYADEVQRRTSGNPQEVPATPPVPAAASSANLERDPFEVSPQLRESSRRTRLGSGLVDGGAINRDLRIKAMARGPDGGIAQVQSGKDVITVRDGDELVVDGIRYTVRVERDGLVLRGAGAPQFKMLVR